MYSYLFFGLVILGLFSIIENLKGNQKISLVKLNFLLFLICVTFNSFIDFLKEFGYDLVLCGTIIRLFTTLFTINIFYLIAGNKVTKLIIIGEVFFFIVYLVAVLTGYRFAIVHDGKHFIEMNNFSRFNFFVFNPLLILVMAYNIIKVLKMPHSNLYQVRVKRWSIFLLVLIFGIVFSAIIVTILHYVHIFSTLYDSRKFLIFYRFVLILFILFRPKFIDDAGLALSINQKSKVNSNISIQNFEFLFYGNQYFLQPEANLENFSLRLNHTKSEVSDFLKTLTSDSFIELINKNRISYFKELLKTKQHESFTIEALSEMSGFNNRQSMYNAFKKYEGCSPTEYLNNL
jgi:AraC-like DNA-binding protein